MHISFKPFCLPKAGNSKEEYEDAYFHRQYVRGKDLRGFLCAVADGATESSFSKLWANLLVRKYCSDSNAFSNPLDSITDIQEEWLNQVNTHPLPWYAEEKVKDGAFAALVGITLEPRKNKNGVWKSVAFGDSCLFQVRGEQVIASFPLEKETDFSHNPILISSNSLKNKNVCVKRMSGEWENGDIFYLMTDAMAQWFMKRQMNDRSAVTCLSDVKDVSDFQMLIREERMALDPNGKRWMKNDDVTLIRLKLQEGG